MPKTRKSELYQLARDNDVTLPHSYQDITIEQLEAALNAAEVSFDVEPADVKEPAPAQSNTPDPQEMPAQRLNTKDPDEVIRVDDEGREWLQEEVPKPAYPKPRGRRVLNYIETGVEEQTVQAGEYVETFEVAGKGVGKPAQVKITLPSYQVGIYRDRRFPFKIYTYNGRQGFDLFEVQQYYGGAEMVPPTCKRVYVENTLCYDIRSVIQTIRAEHRQLQLTGRIK